MQVGELFIKLSLDDKQFEQLLANSEQKVKGFGESFKNALSVAAGNLLTQAINGVAAAVGNAVNTASEFQKALSAVSAVAGGLSSNQLESLRQKALEIGATTSLSASQAVTAFEALVANGIAVDQNFNTIADATVALAEATGGDLTTAANVATDTMANFGISAANIGQVINGITGVTVAGKFGIDDYRHALAQAGGVAGTVGVELADFNTVIAGISPLFASGSDAGTSFKTFLMRLPGDTGPAAEKMRELGLITADGTNKFYDASGSLKSMEEISVILNGALGGLSEQQKTTALSAIFGADAMRAAAGIMGLAEKSADGTSTKFAELAGNIAKISAADQAAERLNNFAGASEELKGSLETLAITIGTPIINALTPFIQMLSRGVGALTQFASSIINAGNPIQFFIDKINSVLPGFAKLAANAAAWGRSLVSQYIAGMTSAYGPLINALKQVGQIISSWLQPNSPPKIVPQLDQYGIDAGTLYYESFALGDPSALMQMSAPIENALTDIGDIAASMSLEAAQTASQAFIDAWGSADYGALENLSQSFSDALRGIVDSGMAAIPEEGIIPMIMGGRQAITEAINEFKTVGKVSEEAIRKIVTSAGAAGPSIEGLVRSFFKLEDATRDVAKAQQELNRITQEYAGKIGPLQDQLNDVQARQQQIRDQERIAELQEVLADGTATAAEKEQAALEIEEIRLRQQIEGLEQERDTALEAAQVKLESAEAAEKAAQAEYAAQQAQLQSTNTQNALIKEQTELLRRLAEAQAASGGGASAGGGISMPEVDPSVVTEPMAEISNAVDTAATSFTNAYIQQHEAMSGIQSDVTNTSPLVQIMEKAFAGLQVVIAAAGSAFTTYIAPILQQIGMMLQTSVIPMLLQLKDALFTAFGQSGPTIEMFKGALLALTPVWQGLSLLAQVAVAGVIGVFNGLVGFVSGAIPGIGAVFQGVAQVIQGVAQIIGGVIGGLTNILKSAIEGDWNGAWASALAMFATFTAGFSNIWQGLYTVVIGLVQTLVGGVAGFFDGLVTTVTGQASSLATQVVSYFETMKTDAIAKMKAFFDGIIQWFKDLYDEVVGNSIVPDMVKGVIDEFIKMKDDAIAFAKALYEGAIEQFNTLKTNALEAVSGLATDLKTKVGEFTDRAKELGTNLVEGIIKGLKEAASSLYDAVRGIIASALGAGEEEAETGSPSRATEERLGIPFVQGILVGIESMIPDVEAAARALTQGFIQAAGERLDELKDLYTEFVKDMLTSIMSINTGIIDSAKQVKSLFAPSVLKDLKNIYEENSKRLADLQRISAELAEKERQSALETAKIREEEQKARIDAEQAIKRIEQERAQEIAKIEQERDKKIAEQQAKRDEQIAKRRQKLQQDLAKVSATGAGLAERQRLIDEANADIGDIRGDANKSIQSITDTARAKVLETALKAEESIAKTREQLQEKLNDLRDKQLQIEKDLADAIKAKLKAEQDYASWAGEASKRRDFADAAVQEQLKIAREAEKAIQELEKQALAISDPQIAQKFYETRRKQILELAQLDQEITEARFRGDPDEIKRLERQRALTVQNHQIQKKLLDEEIKQIGANNAARASQIQDLVEQLTSVFRAQAFEGVGTQVAQGILQGIVGSMGQISQALTAGMQQAIEDLRRSLGIASPSKVAAKMIGTPLAQGILKPLTNIRSNVGNMLSGISQEFLNMRMPTIPLSLTPAYAAVNAVPVSAPMPVSQTTYNISMDLRGSNLTKTDVEKVIDTRLDKIVRITKTIK